MYLLNLTPFTIYKQVTENVYGERIMYIHVSMIKISNVQVYACNLKVASQL